MSAPCVAQRVVPGAPVDADDECEAAGAAGRDSRDRVLGDDGAVGGTPSSSAASRNVSGAGLPGRSRAAATLPSTTTSKRAARPAASSTSAALRDDDTTPTAMPRSVRASSKRTEPGYGSMPSRRRTVWNIAFFMLPRAITVPWPGRRGVPSGSSMSREAMNDRTPSNRGLPST